MFTGLVEHLGTIAQITPTTQFAGFSFLITDAAPILVDCQVGDSIAVNGACLTVTEFDAAKGEFNVNLANETLDRTNLGKPLPKPRMTNTAYSAHTATRPRPQVRWWSETRSTSRGL